MEEAEEPGALDNLFLKTKAYIATNLELFKLRAVEKTSEIISVLVYRLIIFTIISIFTVMFNVGIAFWLGELLGHISYGFFIVSAVYLMIALIVFKFRERIVKTPVSETIINQLLKDDLK